MCQGPVLHDEETTGSRFLRIYRTMLSVAWGSPNEAFLRYTKINKCQWNFLQLSPAVGTIQEKIRDLTTNKCETEISKSINVSEK